VPLHHAPGHREQAVKGEPRRAGGAPVEHALSRRHESHRHVASRTHATAGSPRAAPAPASDPFSGCAGAECQTEIKMAPGDQRTAASEKRDRLFRVETRRRPSPPQSPPAPAPPASADTHPIGNPFSRRTGVHYPDNGIIFDRISSASSRRTRFSLTCPKCPGRDNHRSPSLPPTGIAPAR